MASFGGKTPVSLLNEYAMKKGFLPKFDLIMNGRGMLVPMFAYVVQFENHVAMGEGRSKQEAKHQAAARMLEELKLPCEEEFDGSVQKLVVPYENSIGYNAVGGLSEYCGKTCYPEPDYDLVLNVGPPHEKMFTMKCIVSKLSTIGEARTKKKAKQIAAHKMLMQLQLEAGDEPMAVALPKKPTDYSELTGSELPRVTPVYQPQVHLYKDYCNAYINIEEKSETIAQILEDWDSVTLENSCKILLKISQELAVSVIIEQVDEFTHCELPLNTLEVDYNEDNENNDDESFIFVSLEVHPPIVCMGNTIFSAAFQLLNFLRQFTS